MKYTGTYSCGHEGAINLFGPTKDREWKVERTFSGLCPDCFKKKQQEEREKENKISAIKSAEMELPELTGSEKQAAWANTIRLKIVEKLDQLMLAMDEVKDPLKTKNSEGELFEVEKDELSEAIDFCLVNQTTSRFWIDHKNPRSLVGDMITLYRQQKHAVPEEVQEEMEAEKEALTVKPSEPVKSGIVRIEKTEKGSLIAKYPKDDDFKEIVKSKGYIWYNGAWTKYWTEFKNLDNCAAELGNALLSNGFTVEFMNIQQRDAAISGEFTPEKKRWVNALAGSDKLLIFWREHDNEIYEAARRLPGAKWSSSHKGMLVPVEFYQEIEDFSGIYDFGFSEGAREAIEKYKKKQQGFLDASITETDTDNKISAHDRLREQLEAGGTIIEDLRDDS